MSARSQRQPDPTLKMVQDFKKNMNNVFSYNVPNGNLNSIRRKLKSSPGMEKAIIAAEGLKIKQFVEKKAAPKTAKKTTGKKVSGMTKGVSTPNLRRKNVLTTLANLRNNKAPTNGRDRAAWQVLASVYRDHPVPQLQKYVNMNDEEREKFMTRQHEALTKSTALLESNSTVVNIPMNTEKMHDLLLMLWLDMSHDGLFSESFDKYLKSGIKKIFTSAKIEPTKTELVTKFMDENFGPILKINKMGEIVKTSDVEKKLKTYMHDIWGDQSYPPKKIGKTRSIQDLIKNKSNPIYVSYDAENSDYVTTLIQSSFDNKSKTYFLKRLFTIANLMDPGRGAAANLGGRGKSGGSVDKLMNRLFSPRITNNGNFFIQTPFKFNYQMLTFNFGDYFQIKLIQDGYKFNAKLNDIPLKMQVKAAVARTGNTIDKISKTFGDFLQILTVSHLRRATKKPVVSSSQDGGFVGMTGYVQSKLFGIKPMLISDDTGLIGTGNNSTGIIFYGLHEYLKQNAMPTFSRPTTLQVNSAGSAASMNFRGNNNNNVSSGNTSSNNNNNAKLTGMLMKQSTPPKPNNTSKSNKNLAQALANSKRLTNKWQSVKRNAVAKRNKIRNNFRTVVNAAVKQNKNKKEVEKKAKENAENEMSRLRAELEEAKKTALNAQKEVENQRRKTIKRKREETLLNINNSRRTRSRR